MWESADSFSNIGGCTLHSWAGIGLGKLPASKLADNIVKNKMTLRRWQQVGALIIDEGHYRLLYDFTV